jgi:phosphohistidine phosphatase
VQSRRLLVIRHARAGQDAATDAERPLTDEGAQAAEALGSWLAGHDLRPDHALVSSAVRAVETWAAVARGAGWELEPEVSRPLYAAEPESALDLVREVDDAVGTLALVGHNPTVGSLAQLLDDGEGDADAGTAMATSGFPAGAVAVLEHEGDWADLAWGSARLVAYRA